MKKIGVVGGLGPMATIYYLELLTLMTDASKDQEYPRIYLESLPDIPDRTAYILHESLQDPRPIINHAMKELEKLGAEVISIPCLTAHCFYDTICKEISVPIVNLPAETASLIANHDIDKVGIIATSGTIHCQVFEKEFDKYNIEAVIPDKKYQEYAMNIIYDQVKKDLPIQWNMFSDIINHLKDKGASTFILGCTELSLLKREVMTKPNIVSKDIQDIIMNNCIDILEVLSYQTLSMADVKIKKEYNYLK